MLIFLVELGKFLFLVSMSAMMVLMGLLGVVVFIEVITSLLERKK